jgi:hypothetical protein
MVLSINGSPIVDIENIRKSGEIGRFNNLEFALAGSRGNEERNDYDIGISLVNNSSTIERLFVYEKSERTNNDVIEDESTFLHARILWQIENSKYDFETYIQSSENPFQSYKRRDLFGVGVRFSQIQYIKLSLSLLHENEESLLGENKNTDRINLYAHKNIDFENDSFISFSTFFQPSLDDFSNDYKLSASLSYNVPVSENFLIKVKFTDSFDNDPPDFAEESDQSFVTSFNYSF